MKKNKDWKDTVGLVVASILVMGIVFSGMIGLMKLLVSLDISHNGFFLQGVPRVIATLILILVFKVWNRDITLGLRRKNLFKGIFLGWLLIIFSFQNIYFALLGVDWNKALSPSLWDYICYIIYIFAIAFFEETLVRGVILNLMYDKWGRTKSGIYMAAIMSGLVFGAFHIINLLDCPWLIVTTITQVIYATFIGVFFAAIYLRSRNLWVVIFLHAIVDFTGCYGELFDINIRQNLIPDISVSGGVYTVIKFSVFLILGLFYLRKVKPERGIRYIMRVK